jgi:NADH dehydrogenase
MKPRPRVVVVGAGYAGLNAALVLADRLDAERDAFDLELVDRLPYHLVKVRLHEVATGDVHATDPLREVLHGRSATVKQATLTGLDFPGRRIFTTAGPVTYDYLILALGSRTNFFGIAGLENVAFSLDNLADAVHLRGHVNEQVVHAAESQDPAERERLLRFVVGGAGYTGIELAAELAELLPGLCSQVGLGEHAAQVVVVDGHSRILPVLDEGGSGYAAKALESKGIQFRLGVRVTACSVEGVTLNPGGLLPTATMIWAGGICADPLLATAGVEVNRQGRLVVDETWRLPAYPEVYAVGDCAVAMDPSSQQPIPATAQLGLQEGRHAAESLLRVLAGKESAPFDPHARAEVVSLGHDRAVGWVKVLGERQIALRGMVGEAAKRVSEAEWDLHLWRETHHLHDLYEPER